MGAYGGKLTSFGTRRMIGGFGIRGISGGLQEQETLLGLGVRKTGDWAAGHSKQIKALGVATAWKTAGSALELVNYTSWRFSSKSTKSNGYENGNLWHGNNGNWGQPLVIAGIIGNELISAGVDAYKYCTIEKWKEGEL